MRAATQIFLFGGDQIGGVDFGQHLAALHRIAGGGDGETLDPAGGLSSSRSPGGARRIAERRSREWCG